MNEYTVSAEIMRSLKAGLTPPPAAPPSRRLSPGKNGPPGPGKNLLPRCDPSRRGAGRRASFCRRTRGARRRRPCNGWANISRPYRAAARPGGRGMAAAAQERCVTAWPPSWGSDNASPPPSTGSGLRTYGGRLSPFCLRTWSWPTPATWWQIKYNVSFALRDSIPTPTGGGTDVLDGRRPLAFQLTYRG